MTTTRTSEEEEKDGLFRINSDLDHDNDDERSESSSTSDDEHACVLASSSSSSSGNVKKTKMKSMDVAFADEYLDSDNRYSCANICKHWLCLLCITIMGLILIITVDGAITYKRQYQMLHSDLLNGKNSDNPQDAFCATYNMDTLKLITQHFSTISSNDTTTLCDEDVSSIGCGF